MASFPLPQDLQSSLAATKVTYSRVGSSGLRVSVPILGAMSFGSKRWAEWNIEEQEALPLLKAAYDRGLNTWDTANMYSNGVSESIIGRALKEYSIPRHKVVILTKCFFGANEEDLSWQTPVFLQSAMATASYANAAGLSRNAILHQVDESLKRLQTDYIDLLQIHRYDPNVPIEETMKALHDLVQSGKVRYIGASSMWAWQFAQMQFVAEKNGWTKFISMQNQYSLRYREEEREMNAFCKATGVGLIPWSPIAGGALARPLDAQPTTRSSTKGGPPKQPLTEADKEITRRVEEVAQKRGLSMSQVALLWVIQKGCTPIVGFSSVQRIDEGCGVKGKTLTGEDVQYLEEPYEPKRVVGHV